MVIDQLPIFDLGAITTETSAPRCRMCARPSRWLTTQQQYAMYCAGRSCSNRERICQNCGSTFEMNVDGAGSKYCSTACKTVGYHPTTLGLQVHACAWCEKKVEMHRKYGRGYTWPYICKECMAPIEHLVPRLKAHHVPHERARALTRDPGCEVCGRDIVTPVRDKRTNRPVAPLVVDHDHSCCPSGSYSCGRCVRGLLCGGCNSAAGLLQDDPANAKALGDYLGRFFP